MDYSKTLNLPQTEFPMRAGLPEREPELLAYWAKNNTYAKKLAASKGKTKFILHDGPPYANGNIHIGTALNKIIKDIIIKYKSLRGYDSPYVPGWDTHGMPIEHAAIKILGLNRHELDPLELRRECKQYALKCLDMQREDFIRLGVHGDWENPYVTLYPAYEAKQIGVFGEMAKKGYIYKGLKSVYWCTSCETALAEAEIEYAEKKSHSIYVKFPLVDDKGNLPVGVDDANVYCVIWTTTPWTLPANTAIAIHPELDYIWARFGNDVYLLADGLAKQVAEATNAGEFTVLGEKMKGETLAGMVFSHPFFDRESVVVLGEHVTLEAGTGCVHTAPGHGQEDFDMSVKWGIPVINPVDHAGKFTAEGGMFQGMFVEDANVPVIKELAQRGLLLGKGTLRHQYAHCWRCKNPIIYRATEQWFASVDGFRAAAVANIPEVQWIPPWGEERFYNMVSERQDWCISRQRVWGVPIPIFYCTGCGKHIVNDATITAVQDLFRREGSDAWWKYDASQILPAGFACECGHTAFRKETDTMDVWFDSGSSHAAVLEERPELSWPASMYLEGTDQHRGWFQSSFLTSVATRGRAPYEAVLTHGFVVDGDGRKMSKSLGNVILPQEVIKQYGADILRLWVASADYKTDIRISGDILKHIAEVYRKIRNTFRYLLGNLADFNPDTDKVDYDDLLEIDRWALLRLEQVRSRVAKAFDDYEFHLVYHTVHNFCTIDLSAIYLDILKDRLYTSLPGSVERRAAQTTMYELLVALVAMISPVLTFTAEEVWQHMPKTKELPESVQLAAWPRERRDWLDAGLEAKWDKILALRGEITKALENARRAKTIGHSLDAAVDLYADGDEYRHLMAVREDLATILIVSQARVVEGVAKAPEGSFRSDELALVVAVAPATGGKCERCWNYSDTVGHDTEHAALCHRCAGVVKKL